MMTHQSLIESYDFYKSLGFKLVPVHYKYPCMGSWLKLTQDDLLLHTNGQTGFGIVMTDKICAVDIDDDKYLSEFPDSPWVKVGNVGETRFFLHDGYKYLFGGRPVDFISMGQYTVPPPFPCSPDKFYKWKRFEGKWKDLPFLDKSYWHYIDSLKPKRSILWPKGQP